jgi:hypothetical protein
MVGMDESEEVYSFGSYCGNGFVYAVRLLCGDDLGKKVVIGQIKKIVYLRKAAESALVEVERWQEVS